MAAQVAITLALVVSASALVRSVRHLDEMAPGFDREVVVAQIRPAPSKRSDPAVFLRFLHAVRDGAAHAPGVTAAAVSTDIPFDNDSLSLIVLDVDGLLGVNETRGYDAGDRLLLTLGELLLTRLRVTDIAARIGDDDFAVILPRTPLAGADLRTCVAVCARVRLHSQRATRARGTRVRISLRVNGAAAEADCWEGESLLFALREKLGYPGSKNACEQGECGSCSVLLDGELVC